MMNRKRKNKNSKKELGISPLPMAYYILIAGSHEKRLLGPEENVILRRSLSRLELVIYETGMNMLSIIEDENRSPLLDVYLISLYREKCKENNEIVEINKRLIEKAKELAEDPDKMEILLFKIFL